MFHFHVLRSFDSPLLTCGVEVIDIRDKVDTNKSREEMSAGCSNNDMSSYADRKRKLDFTSDDIIWEDFPPHKKRKKKKSKKRREFSLRDNNESGHNLCRKGNTQMNNSSTFAVVNAKPENLAPTPEIFNKKQNQNWNKLPDTSDLFYMNCIPDKSFRSDIKSRFINFIRPCDQKNKKQIDGNEYSKARSRKHKIDPELVKFRQKQAEIARRKHEVKQRLEELVDEGLKSIEERVRFEENHRDEDIPTRIDPVDIYKTCLKESVIFHMHYPSEFSFYGEIKITVIAGEIEIFGCTVSESTIKTVDVYSPNFYNPWVIECKESKQNYDKEEVRSKIEHLLEMNDVNKLLNNLKYNGAVLLIEQIKSTFGGVIDLYFPKRLFCKDLEDFSSGSESLKSLQSTFNFRPIDEGIRKNLQWNVIPTVHCTVICGGQGVGKSTLFKYFVNKALTQNKKVLCLDFDPGQPEFTPSGCLSAVIVDKPLLGPNFSHMIDPEVMVYFGGVDVAYSPSMYLEGVSYVIEKCREREDLSNMIWFVNTMGFNRGVGVELMAAVIKLSKPDIVVQIRSSDMKKNYPCYFTPRHVNGKDNAWSVLKDKVELSYDLRVVDSVVEKGKKLQGGLSPKQLRDVLFFSYFSKMVSSPSYSFNSVKPYLKSFSNLYLGIESLISPAEILKAFNGSVVALSHFEHGSEEIFVPEVEADDYFKIVVKPATSSSFGLGLVRGIDIEEKKLYILTHLPEEKLNKVNCLKLGRIHTPYSIFLIQEGVVGQIPYTCVSTIDSIQKVNRLFPNPPNASGNDK